MVTDIKLKCSYLSALALVLLQLNTPMCTAQRPSFAGLRPPGGLSQKDKYHAPQNTAAALALDASGVANRFGGADTVEPITIAYGAEQKPPSGVDLVTPSAVYVPLVNAGTVVTQSAAPQFVVNNRLGEADNSNTATSGSALGSGSASTQMSNQPSNSANVTGLSFSPSTVTTTQRSVAPLPLDAHGDQALVDHLSRLPLDQQPFWFINYQAIEAQRNNPRPNIGALETRGSFFNGK